MSAQPAVYEPVLPRAAVTGDGAWSPNVDVRELPDEYIVLADLPGVQPGTVAVTAKGDTLTITGARRDRLHAGGVPFRLERPTGKLRRSIPLPGPYQSTKIRTQIQDGVLEIRVPKQTISESSGTVPIIGISSKNRSGAGCAHPRRGRICQVDDLLNGVTLAVDVDCSVLDPCFGHRIKLLALREAVREYYATRVYGRLRSDENPLGLARVPYRRARSTGPCVGVAG